MATMRAWQFKSTGGGLENNLFMPAAGIPRPKIKDHEILVEVYSMALNPVDYKVAELPLVSRLMVSLPSTPGMDFCGRVDAIGSKVDWASVDQVVFGSRLGQFSNGTLAQFSPVSKEMCTVMPDGLQVDDAASVGVVGVTGYQALKPFVKEGDKVFINGGSGGTGVWTIQIAKLLGCHVTTTCSTTNIDICKSLGADEVIDYKSVNIIKTLQEKGQVFDHTVDNIGSPIDLYHNSHLFLKPSGRFVQVGFQPAFGSVAQLVGDMIRPGFLGGGKRKYTHIMAGPHQDQFRDLGQWMKEGKIRPVVDSVFEFEEAPRAFEKLKTGRAKGKIVIRVKKP
ncbi:reticulon-4-interacting protein 1, mitochondrial precursor [Polyplosphaeria fusca]|uniref:Reticulon-4-interacting protein 1, mitochondrial n=1 Tax=Polyplosphaeria fusca TaxID=682080 RepID=A0A9P4V446_9PLEO|nr:reticulon-4-interacting protein 1, mitochondrial precursor [Polyplosphaeria fusca]